MSTGFLRALLIVLLLTGCVSRSASSPSTPPASTEEPTAGPTAGPTATVASSPPALPAASLSSDPGAAVGATGWREVGSFGGTNSVDHANAVTFGTDQFVAVGTHYGVASLPDVGPVPHEGRIWLSSDGASWEELPSQPLFADATLEGIVNAQDETLIIFGTIYRHDFETGADTSEPAVWRSTDGRDWQRADLGLPSDLYVSDVVHGAQGYLLHGWTLPGGSTPDLWLSADGLAWERVYEGSDGGIVDIGAGDEGFVAFKSGSGDSLVAIASADGHEWFEGDALAGWSLLAPLQADWISVSLPPVADMPRELTVSLSANGLTWNEVAGIRHPTNQEGFGLAGLVSAGGRVFVSTCPFAMLGARCDSWRLWSSLDGATWEPADSGMDGLVVDAAEHDGQVVLAGYVGIALGRATFWLNERP